MKLVVAYVRPERLAMVREALLREDVRKISAEDAFGCGDLPGGPTGPADSRGFHSQVRLEIAVNEPFVSRTVKAILSAARTGGLGDGKVFVLDLGQCWRIRDGEDGMEAIG